MNRSMKSLTSLMMVVLLSVASNQQSLTGDDDYTVFLTSNVVRYTDIHYGRAFCPTNTSLLHGSLKEICIRDQQDDTEKEAGTDSNAEQEGLMQISEGLSRYLSMSAKYSDWIPPFKPADVQSELPVATTATYNDREKAKYTAEQFSQLKLSKYWPFNLQVNRDNQKLAILGITGELVESNIKTEFYNALQLIQNVTFPVFSDDIGLSFEDGYLVQAMLDTELLPNSLDFIFSGKHILASNQRQEISKITNEALELIREVDMELYQAIIQVVSMLAYYNSEDADYIGGTVSSLIGIIWLDPAANWTRDSLAEQIVHEYIHMSIFIEDLVHGMYTDLKWVNHPEAKTVSAIRKELRPYDKSFHAAYVSTGLVFYHSHASKINHESAEEHLTRIEFLQKTLGSSITDLRTTQNKTGVLSPCGNEMLKHIEKLVSKANIEN